MIKGREIDDWCPLVWRVGYPQDDFVAQQIAFCRGRCARWLCRSSGGRLAGNAPRRARHRDHRLRGSRNETKGNRKRRDRVADQADRLHPAEGGNRYAAGTSRVTSGSLPLLPWPTGVPLDGSKGALPSRPSPSPPQAQKPSNNQQSSRELTSIGRRAQCGVITADYRTLIRVASA
jgi:hypothetical protein